MSSKPILIVDDEKNIRLALSMSLEKLELPVETAASGEEALEKLAQESYELMLLDLRMPGLDGMEVLRRVSQQLPDLKVIIITAYGSIDLAVEAMKLGAVDFLQKPFDAGQVREVVRRILEKEGEKHGYWDYLALAKERIKEGYFEVAGVYAQKAVFLNPDKPEALNLLGGIAESTGNRREAEEYYRAALGRYPHYTAAKLNLKRLSGSSSAREGIVWD
ncbi:MAG: response regulator [Thermodesulfobacteriota bacterium]